MHYASNKGSTNSIYLYFIKLKMSFTYLSSNKSSLQTSIADMEGNAGITYSSLLLLWTVALAQRQLFCKHEMVGRRFFKHL